MAFNRENFVHYGQPARLSVRFFSFRELPSQSIQKTVAHESWPWLWWVSVLFKRLTCFCDGSCF